MSKGIVKSLSKPRKEKPIKKSRFFLQKFQLNANLKGFKVGTIINLECFKDTKAPRDSYWRARLKDAEVDGCIVKYREPKPLKEKKKEEEDFNE